MAPQLNDNMSKLLRHESHNSRSTTCISAVHMDTDHIPVACSENTADQRIMHEIDNLLGTRFASDFPELASHEAVTKAYESYLQHTRTMLHEIDASVDSAHALTHRLRQMVLEIEDELVERTKWLPLSTAAGIQQAGGSLVQLVTPQPQTGMFLRRNSAFRLLDEHKPTGLLEHIGMASLPGLFDLLDPFHVLSLTRHTESKNWQRAYKKQLTQLDASHFEQRPVEFIVLDMNKYSDLLTIHSKHPKPWRISHNKEVGVITCFTHPVNHTMVTPNLMFAAVFLHYFFETHYAGLFNTLNSAQHPKAVGRRFTQAIQNNVEQLGFFNPHSYTESLYWDKALTTLSRATEHPMLRTALSHMPALGWVPKNAARNATPVSLNIVDHIWDVNFPNDFDTPNTYHFREMHWYKLFPTLLQIDTYTFEKEVVANSHLGDKAFTRHMIDAYLTSH